ncbi:MAG: hypothetical protein LC107_12990 [Chitinophagales bacterium]|nr:hypothetical protein [Chitinophagales bacterium]
MNIRFKTIIGLLTFCSIVSLETIQAQSKINFLEGSLSYLVPSGPFSKNITTNHLGFELGYLRQIDEDQPFFWGISAYYFNIGSFHAITTEVIDFGIYDFDSATNSNLIGLDGKFRYYPNINLGPIELYLEAMLGFKWLFTFTRKELVDQADTSSGEFDEGQIALSYGMNAGLQVKLSRDIYLNGKGGYYPGLSVPYYALSDQGKSIYTTLDAFDRKRSTTDIIRFDLGITYIF